MFVSAGKNDDDVVSILEGKARGKDITVVFPVLKKSCHDNPARFPQYVDKAFADALREADALHLPPGQQIRIFEYIEKGKYRLKSEYARPGRIVLGRLHADLKRKKKKDRTPDETKILKIFTLFT